MKTASAGIVATTAATLALVAVNRLAPCPLTGDAKPGTLEYRLNPLKNRADVPQSVEAANLTDWLARKADDAGYPDGVGVQLTGYVREVKSGGPESCGCHSATDLDIHIELTPNPGDGEQQVVVVEVTPQFQRLHPDWTLANLRKTLKGRVCAFTGLPFADLEHVNASYADSPNNPLDWRGTVWELHPVTAIESRR